MTKKTLRTEEVLAAYNVLSGAKYGKLEDADKIKVWKATRVLKPIATKFDEDSKDAWEKMKPSDDYDSKLARAQEYERKIKMPDLDATTLPMGAAEYGEFIEEFKRYNKLVADTINDFAQQEVTVDVELLSEESFGKLMASNDWTLAQANAVADVITD